MGQHWSQLTPTKRIEDWLNNYPRKMFGYLCSEQLFREEIALILAS